MTRIGGNCQVRFRCFFRIRKIRRPGLTAGFSIGLARVARAAATLMAETSHAANNK